MHLSVIIVNYNVKYYLEQCLLSVVRSACRANLEWEAFVVDNASSDDSVAYLEARFPKSEFPMVHFISNAGNVGFSRANNQAVKLAKGDYILFLNPDTIVSETTFSDVFAFVKDKDKVGAVGAKMLSDRGQFALESRRALPTPWVSFCKMSGLTALFPKSKTFGRYYEGYLDKEQPNPIEILSGAFMLASRKAIEECGSFDETFFMYGEDIDLSYRFIKQGYQNYYVPTPIVHYKGESTHKSSYRYAHVFYEAMLIFFRKHYGHLSWVFTFPIKCAIIFRALITIIQQQVYAIFPSETGRLSFAYFGSKENFALAEQLAQKWQIQLEYLGENLPTEVSLTAAKQCTHILIDTATVEYSAAFAMFEKSEHRQAMAYFYPQSMKIITGSFIYV